MSSDNPFRDPTNPYRSDVEGSAAYDEATMDPNGEIAIPSGMRRGMVGHVPVVGWLMVVQGVLELVVGTGLIAAAYFLPAQMAPQVQNNPAIQNQGANFTPDQMALFITVVYGGMGAISLVLGLLSVFAGYRMTRFRSHTLGIVALCGGFFTIFGGCYCFPTALALGIYGLIVMLGEPVKCAFAMGKRGNSVKHVKEAFPVLPK